MSSGRMILGSLILFLATTECLNAAKRALLHRAARLFLLHASGAIARHCEGAQHRITVLHQAKAQVDVDRFARLVRGARRHHATAQARLPRGRGPAKTFGVGWPETFGDDE